jgi:hypothetical protein
MSLIEGFEWRPDEVSGEHGTDRPSASSPLGAVAAGWRQRRRWLPLAAAAATGALVAGTVPAIAAAGAGAVTYHACVTNSTGAIKIVGRAAACGRGQHKISWNSTGPAGPQGPPGPRGRAGLVSAYVDTSTGAALTNIHLTTVASLDLPAGTYLVSAALNPFVDVANNGDDFVTCNMVDSRANQLDSSTVDLNPPPQESVEGSMSLVGGSTLTSAGSVHIVCDNGTGDNGAHMLLVVMTATKVAQITRSSG